MSAATATVDHGADHADAWRPAVNPWVIALAVSLGAILEVIDTVIVNVALPDLRGNLGATLSEAGWVISLVPERSAVRGAAAAAPAAQAAKEAAG